MPIDNCLPLPDNDLSDPPNKNIRYEYGPYKLIPYCKECRFYPNNRLDLAYRSSVCPNCGVTVYSGKFMKRIARLQYKREIKGFWIFKKEKVEIIGISLKEDI